MKLVSANIEDVKYYKKTKNQTLLEEFINSGEKCCEVIDYHQKNAKSCCWSLRNSARIFGLSKIIVITRKEKVYLIRDDI